MNNFNVTFQDKAAVMIPHCNFNHTAIKKMLII